MDEKTLLEIKNLIKDARLILFLGGAGASTGSGIPDFRSPQGLYNIENKYGVSYETMLSHQYFYSHLEEFYEFYWDTMVNLAAKPNRAHLALANYSKRKNNLIVITQNIDGLHEKAGSPIVLPVHGSVYEYACLSCQRNYKLDEISHKGIPHCQCGGILKPLVTLYGESLDGDILYKAYTAASQADLLIVGGTSLNVYPIADLPTSFRGKAKIIINKEPTKFDREFDYVIHEDIQDVLEAIFSE